MVVRKIDELKKKIVIMADIARKMVEKSIKGLVDKDETLLKEVIEQDEPEINKLEIEIDKMCTDLIALYQPKAGDLRTILMILKMNNDLERIGDLAVNISESADYLIKRPMVKPLIDIPRMAGIVQEMLSDAINSFLSCDAKLAKRVCEKDDLVDSLRDQILRELVTYMIADPGTIERALHLLRISRNLERVGDLSTNICEDVIFMVEGKIIKHGGLKEETED